MRIARDASYDSLSGNNISTPVVLNHKLSPDKGTISSGSYTILFEEIQWLDCTLTCQQSSYVALGGTQIVNVSGTVTSSGITIDGPGTITFSLPFPVPSNFERITAHTSIIGLGENYDDYSVLNISWYNPIAQTIVINVIGVGNTRNIKFSTNITLPMA